MILTIVALFGPILTAEACDRCGVFGRRCHFSQQQVVQQVAYTPPAANQQTTFNFVNSFPTPYLLSGQQGSSVYGYSLAAAPYTLDANLFMDRAARFTELALQSSDDANKAFAANTAQAMALNDSADRRTKNTLLALSAIQANSDPATTQKPLSFQATVTNGRLSIRQIDPQQPNPLGGTPGAGVPPGSALAACAKCHDGSGKNRTPQGFSLDGSQQITAEQYAKCIDLMSKGEMPPGNRPLSPAEAIAVTDALCGLKQRPAVEPGF